MATSPFSFSGCLRSCQFADFRFVLSDGSFPAHKVVLAARSPFFAEMFAQDGSLEELVLSVPSEVLLPVLEYFYTDRAKVHFDIELDVVRLARNFQLDNLEMYILAKHGHPRGLRHHLNPWGQLAELFDQPFLSDVSFVVEGRKFFAHKAIIAARSHYFDSLLRWGWREASQDEVVIHDVPADSFGVILRFLYADRVEFGSIDEAYELLKLGQFFGIESLGLACEEHVVEDFLDDTSVCSIWMVAQSLKAESLADTCLQHFVRRFRDCVHHPGFLSLERPLLKAALNAGSLECTERSVLDALTRWGTAQLFRQGVPADPTKVLTTIEDLLPPHTLFTRERKERLLQGPGSFVDFLMRA
eukprot:TRINITY_DN14647_c0_g1_i1.p1 TRINITY_DN14647_c0_g1~~TRINITY_DN14647_c0_g1_i1.p1  ORF type:complete len:358 (-),score=78.32 TRINITY_DN14647_c0_g1_i1:416-1489(-)